MHLAEAGRQKAGFWQEVRVWGAIIGGLLMITAAAVGLVMWLGNSATKSNSENYGSDDLDPWKAKEARDRARAEQR